MFRSPNRAAVRVPLAVLAAATLSAACASSGPGSVAAMGPAAYGAATSESAVREFLAAANARDYTAMSALFGTSEGAVVRSYGVAEVEQRMIFLSRLLRHDALDLRRADLASAGPGRARYEALLTMPRRGNVLVPVVTVPDGDGRWYVEKLDLDAFSPGR